MITGSGRPAARASPQSMAVASKLAFARRETFEIKDLLVPAAKLDLAGRGINLDLSDQTVFSKQQVVALENERFETLAVTLDKPGF